MNTKIEEIYSPLKERIKENRSQLEMPRLCGLQDEYDRICTQ